MKRREFLVSTSAIAGAMRSGLAFAKTPCPPDLAPGLATCGPGEAPAWFLDQDELTWTTVAPTGTVAAAAAARAHIPSGSLNQLMDAWTGGCVDQVRGELILAASGGHKDYAGNEVYAIALRKEDPAWVMLTQPSVENAGDSFQGSGAYSDGNMRSQHGWGHVNFAEGKVWHPGVYGQYKEGNYTTMVWSFDRDSLGDGPFPVTAANAPWTMHSLGIPGLFNPSNHDWQAGTSAYDPVGKQVWNHTVTALADPTPNPFFSVDVTTGTPTQYPGQTQTFGAGNQRAHSAMSAIVDGIWIIVAPLRQQVMLVDTANPEDPYVMRVPTGSPAAWTQGAGAVYHAASRAMFFYHHTYRATIRKLSIPADPLTGSYVWSSVTNAPGRLLSGGDYNCISNVRGIDFVNLLELGIACCPCLTVTTLERVCSLA